MSTTLREQLINEAASWLFNWNWKAFLQEQNDPHPSDFLDESVKEYSRKATGKEPLPFVVRKYTDAHIALENAVYSLPEAKPYYVGLSDVGFSRLFNQVTRLADERLERRKDVYLRDEG